MANRYWVGGTASWDATAGSKWALTDGGAGGQAVPTSADTVFFTALSGANTVTIGAGTAICSTLTMTGFTGTLAFGTNSIECAGTGTIFTGATTFLVSGTPLILCTNSSATARTISATAMIEARAISFNISAGSGSVVVTGSLKNLIFSGTFTGDFAASGRTLYGNLTLKTGMSVGSGAVLTTFSATSGTQTITSAGLTLDFAVTINGVGGTVTLADSFNASTFGTWSLTNGTFNTNNQNITVSSFSSANSNTRTITMGSSTLTLIGASGWNTTTTTGLTFNANTSTILLSNTSATFAGGGLTYNTVNFTGTLAGSTQTITGANTFTNLSFAAPATAGYANTTFAANQIITGTLTSGGATVVNRVWLKSDTAGTARTLTTAAVSLQNTDFTDITGAGAAAPFTGTNLGNATGNSGITFPAAKTVYWNLAGAQNWSATGWALTSTGTPVAANFPLPQDTATFTNAGSVTGPITVNTNWNIGTLDLGSRTSSMTLTTGTTTPTIYGDWTSGTGASTLVIGTGVLTFAGRNTQTINTGAKTFTQPLTLNSIGGTFRLVNGDCSTNLAFTFTTGTIDLNGFSIYPLTFVSSGTATRVIQFGTSGASITANGAGTVTPINIVGTNLSYTGNSLIGYGPTATANATITLSTGFTEANALSFSYGLPGFAAVTITDASAVYGNLDVSLGIGTLTNQLRTIYGNLTLPASGGTLTAGTNATTFAATSGTQTITSNGRTIDFPVTITGVGGTVSLAGAFTMGATRTLTLTNGTFNANNQNVSVGLFDSLSVNTRTLTMGSGTWTLSGTGTVWNTLVTRLTTTACPNIILSDTSTTARTFSSGGVVLNKLTIGGTTGISTTTIIPGSGGSFTEIASTKTVAHTISFGGTGSIGNWTVTGTAGNVVTVNSSAAGTQRAITYTGSGTISMDYMSIRDIGFSYGLGATQPYLVYAGLNSTNSGNNDGILFQPTTVKAYRLTTGTSWTVPGDWSNASNTIHMIGAGGGGANSAVSGNNRAAGGGGGGGGYTVLTNQTLSGSIPYTIGTSTINANGGDTTFNTTNTAGGGQKGNATTAPTSSGGAGGTGTYAGGNGGAGSFGTTASQGYGSGGGGGAAGPNGIGGNGGTGFASTTSANTAGGGGGGNGGGSNGTAGSSALGGNGGNNFGGTGGGIGTSGGGGAGTLGGGGAGAATTSLNGSGGSGIDIANTIGGGGGQGGTGAGTTSSNTGLYGGGGSGGSVTTAAIANSGGAGSQGVIFIIYTPGATPAVTTGNFFFLYNNVLR